MQFFKHLFPAAKPQGPALRQEMTLKEKFDYIYKHKLWGEAPSGPRSYGGIGSSYIRFLKVFLERYEIKSITDVGCGDFNIGRQLAPLVEKYYALDISSRAIDIARQKHSEFANVTFAVADACTDPVPAADLVTVRQVLQHLTNQQIEMALKSIERSGSKYALYLSTAICLRRSNSQISTCRTRHLPYAHFSVPGCS